MGVLLAAIAADRLRAVARAVGDPEHAQRCAGERGAVLSAGGQAVSGSAAGCACAVVGGGCAGRTQAACGGHQSVDGAGNCAGARGGAVPSGGGGSAGETGGAAAAGGVGKE